MSSGHVSSGPPKPPSTSSPHATPLIPERYIDIPSQRLYALSFALLIQVRLAFVDPRVDNFNLQLIGRKILRLSKISFIFGGQPSSTLWQEVAACRPLILSRSLAPTHSKTKLFQHYCGTTNNLLCPYEWAFIWGYPVTYLWRPEHTFIPPWCVGRRAL